MIRELDAEERRDPNFSVREWQGEAFKAWCRIGDPTEVAHARLIQRREREVAREMAVWLRRRKAA